MLVLTMDSSNHVTIHVGEQTIKVQLLSTRNGKAKVGFAADGKAVRILRSNARIKDEPTNKQTDAA